MKPAYTLGILGPFLLVVACGPQVNHNQAVYVLIDTSGTYAREMNKAQTVVNYLLGSPDRNRSALRPCRRPRHR